MTEERKATFHATYPGDCTHIVGEVKGPTTYGQLQVAVSAEFDPSADSTRVGFAPATQYDVERASS